MWLTPSRPHAEEHRASDAQQAVRVLGVDHLPLGDVKVQRVLREHATLIIRQQMRVAAERAVRGFGSAAFRNKQAVREAGRRPASGPPSA